MLEILGAKYGFKCDVIAHVSMHDPCKQISVGVTPPGSL